MLLQPHPLLWTAIENTRMIRFAYHGKDRLVEPHDHGILNGSVQLLSWQVAGRSSRRLPNWLLTKVDEITDLILLDQIFPGGRPTASDKHIEWDVLFIRVKPASDYLHAGSEVTPLPQSALDPEIGPSTAQPGFGMTYFRRNRPRTRRSRQPAAMERR